MDSRAINVLIDENPYMDGSQPDLLIDDSDSGVIASAAWKHRENAGGYGLSYYESDKGQDSGSVRYTAVIPSDGLYSIYTYQPVGRKYSSVLSVDIEFSGAVHHVKLNRSEMNISGQTSTTWAEIGKYEFSSGEEVEVSITGKDSDGLLRADAVLFVKMK